MLLVGAVAAAGVFVASKAVAIFRPHIYSGTVLQGDAPAAPLDGLVDGNDRAFDVAAAEGDVVLIYFGYTHCPDVCPTTLSAAAQARAALGGAQRDRVHLVMVGVDPERDDAASLDAYVDFFDPSFRAVTGSEADIQRVASLYGVFYSLTEPDDAGDYTVDHTASLMAVGPDGALRVVWPPEVSTPRLQADLAELLG